MVRRAMVWAAGLWVAAAAALGVGLEGRAQGGEPEGVVLDWGTSYWRYQLTFRAPQMKGGGFLPYFRGWHLAPMMGRVRTDDAPADWTKAEFDDTPWAREKGAPDHGSSMYEPVVRVKRVRGRFEVADPAAVTGLKLEMEYIGGVAVWLNGEEVARRHLAAGPLTADVLAEGYPVEAYEWNLPRSKEGYAMGAWEWGVPSEAKAARWRKMSVPLDVKLLRKGANVLAIAVHGSEYDAYARRWDGNLMGATTIKGRGAVAAAEVAGLPTEGVAEKGARVFLCAWPHVLVKGFRFTATPAGSAAPSVRPAGVQVCVEDMHRQVVNRDYYDPPGARPVMRLVGARNGAYSAQVVVSTGGALDALSATMSDLDEVGGAGKIAAGAVRVRYGVGLALEPNLVTSPFERANSYFNGAGNRMLGRYSRAPSRGRQDVIRPTKEMLDEARAIAAFDGIGARAPAGVAAESCQPVWVTVKVPRDAAAGEYRGTLTVQAGSARAVEVRLRVMDWTLPDGKEYASFVGLQESIWSACDEYKAAAWSDEHWKHVERTVALLGEAGNDVAILPLAVNGEGGNKESLVPWVKKGAGYEYEWKNLDRYLELVLKYWGAKASLVGEICWTPWTSKGWAVVHDGVTAVDVATGKREKMTVGAFGSDEWVKAFVPFAKAVVERCKARGFGSFYWGWFYDSVPEPLHAAAGALAAACPNVSWARASHNGNASGRAFSKEVATDVGLDMHIRQFAQAYDAKTGEPVSGCGWKNAGNILFPRVASQIQAVDVFEAPMALRWLTENALVHGAAGFGRIGADFWPPFRFSNWYHPFESCVLWHGPDGAETTARFEALREGVQEAEVRIWLEKTGKDGAEPAKGVLGDRIRAVSALVTGAPSGIGAYCPGWQERSWDLYAAAAGAGGGKVPSAEEKRRFFGME